MLRMEGENYLWVIPFHSFPDSTKVWQTRTVSQTAHYEERNSHGGDRNYIQKLQNMELQASVITEKGAHGTVGDVVQVTQFHLEMGESFPEETA